MTVKDRVRVAREARGWSKNELEKRAQVAVGYVSRLESGERGGKRGITGSTLEKLATALGVSAEWLRSGEGSMYAVDEEPKQIPNRGLAERIARDGGIPEAAIAAIVNREDPNAFQHSTLWWIEEMQLAALMLAREHGPTLDTYVALPVVGERRRKKKFD